MDSDLQTQTNPHPSSVSSVPSVVANILDIYLTLVNY
jgi:hypothetical protein